MSKRGHLIILSSCQTEGNKCINSIHLCHTHTSSFYTHENTRLCTGGLPLDKRQNLDVISQLQMFSCKCMNVIFVFQVHLAFIFGCIHITGFCVVAFFLSFLQTAQTALILTKVHKLADMFWSLRIWKLIVVLLDWVSPNTNITLKLNVNSFWAKQLNKYSMNVLARPPPNPRTVEAISPFTHTHTSSL